MLGLYSTYSHAYIHIHMHEAHMCVRAYVLVTLVCISVAACILLCFKRLPWTHIQMYVHAANAPSPPLSVCVALFCPPQGTMGKLIKQLSKHDSPGAYVRAYVCK